MDDIRKELHIGACIKAELEQQGKTTVWLAEKLGYNRTSVYKLYNNATLDSGLLFRVSCIMHFDFFKLYTKKLRG